MREAGLIVGHHTKRASDRRDSVRVKQAVARVQDKHKKYRLARRQAKAKEEELRVRREGQPMKLVALMTLLLSESQKRKGERSRYI